jgi:Annexin
MVPVRYENLFGKYLKDTMKSECGKKPFGIALQLLAVNPVESECDMIDRACQGLGTNDPLVPPFMLGMKLKPYETVAKMIHCACKGFGTNEHLLTATLIRYQPMMKLVVEAHIELFGETIEDRVQSECFGDYKL